MSLADRPDVPVRTGDRAGAVRAVLAGGLGVAAVAGGSLALLGLAALLVGTGSRAARVVGGLACAACFLVALTQLVSGDLPGPLAHSEVAVVVAVAVAVLAVLGADGDGAVVFPACAVGVLGLLAVQLGGWGAGDPAAGVVAGGFGLWRAGHRPGGHGPTSSPWG